MNVGVNALLSASCLGVVGPSTPLGLSHEPLIGTGLTWDDGHNVRRFEAGPRRVYELFREKFDEVGMPPISYVGHGIGVDLHEPPYLAAFADQVLEPEMVLGIEPLVYRIPHDFRMQMKDMVAIEERGCRLMSDTTGAEEPLRTELL
ncbi:MAG: M24 family metallopeptidase [Acidimicrobiales bacterium]